MLEADIKDYYNILQVSSSATPDQIDSAYKKLIRIYHPDVNSAPTATETMQDLNEARAILCNGESRRAYDVQRAKVLSDKSFLDGLLATPPTVSNAFNRISIGPSAQFATIVLAHGVEASRYCGLAFYISFYIHNYCAKEGRICAFIYDQHDIPVLATGLSPYTTPKGLLTVQDTFAVKVVHGYAKNLPLFLPYNQFPSGYNSYYALLQIKADAGKTLANAKTDLFAVARPNVP